MLPVANVNPAMTISLDLVVARELARRPYEAFFVWRRIKHSRIRVERSCMGWMQYHCHLLVDILRFLRNLAKPKRDKLAVVCHRRPYVAFFVCFAWRRIRHSRIMVERRWRGWEEYHGHFLVAILRFWRKQKNDKLFTLSHRRHTCIRACKESRGAMQTMMSHRRIELIRACMTPPATSHRRTTSHRRRSSSLESVAREREPPATIHDEPQATSHRRERLWATDDDPQTSIRPIHDEADLRLRSGTASTQGTVGLLEQEAPARTDQPIRFCVREGPPARCETCCTCEQCTEGIRTRIEVSVQEYLQECCE